MTYPNTPIVPVSNLYVYGMNLSYVTTTTLSVSAGQCYDSTLTYPIATTTATTINAAVNGINGLDTGSLANNTWYAVYAIYDPTLQRAPNTGFLLSTSATAPLMPSGYGLSKRIGWALTGGSATFLKFYQSGNTADKFYQWDSPIIILNGGSSTFLTAANASVGAPKQVAPIYLNYIYTPANVANTASIRPTGSTAAALSCPIEIKSTVVSVPVKGAMVKILPQLSSGNASIDYTVTTSGDTLSIYVAAFDDYL